MTHASDPETALLLPSVRLLISANQNERWLALDATSLATARDCDTNLRHGVRLPVPRVGGMRVTKVHSKMPLRDRSSPTHPAKTCLLVLARPAHGVTRINRSAGIGHVIETSMLDQAEPSVGSRTTPCAMFREGKAEHFGSGSNSRSLITISLCKHHPAAA